MQKETKVRFSTNVDICKRLMANISGLTLTQINPEVGDLVRVFSNSRFELEMKVISRHWEWSKLTNTTELIVHLGLTDNWHARGGIPALEKTMRENGFGG